jgi:NTE family protein
MNSDPLQILKSSKLFSSLPEGELVQLLEKFKRVELKQNHSLYRQGELSNNLYILMEGKIAIFLKSANKEKILIKEVYPGSFLGEIAALSHEPRSTTAKAVKNCVLLELPSEDFVALCTKHPAMSMDVINSSLRESRGMMKLISEKSASHQHIAIIPASKKTHLQIFHDEFSKQVTRHSNVIFLSDYDETVKTKNYSTLQNETTPLDKKQSVIYLLDSLDSPLAQICLEKVDMIYVVGAGHFNPDISRQVKEIIKNNKYKIQPELILIHDDKKFEKPKNTNRWLKLLPFHMHHQIRLYRETDWQRLLRFMTGTAIAIVFGGGGLRCWAQYGSLIALSRLNIPVDAIGGVSAGAIVASYYAIHESVEEPYDLRDLSAITRNATVSIFNGKDFTKQLQKIFKNVRMENLWIPCFCISTNLSNSKQVIARRGLLWKVIRSSTAVPLVFPPLVVNGRMRIDGGVLNNLPVDIMKKLLSNKGTVIAFELTHANEDEKKYHFPPILTFWKTFLAKTGLGKRNYKFPSFIDTFLKSLLAGSSAKQYENCLLADILLAPDLSKFRLLNVSKEDENQLIKIGFKETVRMMRDKKHQI